MATTGSSASGAVSKKEFISTLESVYGAGSFKTLKAGTTAPANLDLNSLSTLKYSCSTQRANTEVDGAPDVHRLFLGWNNEIPRWRAGSVVKWCVRIPGFPSTNHAIYAAQRLDEAAREWNSLQIGVNFQWIDQIDQAAFVLEYMPNPAGGTLAQAFFPNHRPLNSVLVYSLAFQPANIGMMRAIMLHELGHVLGLRHEFADQEGGAIQFGPRNPFSVMSYQFPPTMQPSDRTDVRAFYAFRQPNLGPWNITDYTPQ